MKKRQVLPKRWSTRRLVLVVTAVVALSILHSSAQSTSSGIQEEVLTSKLQQMFDKFPEEVGFVSKAAAKEPRDQRWSAAFAWLARRYQLPLATTESYLKLLAQRLLKSSSPLLRARAHVIRQEFAQARTEVLRLVREKKTGSVEKANALSLAVICAAEEDRPSDAESHLRQLMALVNAETKGHWWAEDAGRVVNLAARIGQVDIQLEMTRQLVANCSERFGTQHALTQAWKGRHWKLLHELNRPVEALNVMLPLWKDLKDEHGDTARETVTLAVSLVEVMKAAGMHEDARLIAAKLIRISSEARQMLAARETPLPNDPTPSETAPMGRAQRSKQLSAQGDEASELFDNQSYAEAEQLLREVVVAAGRDLGPEDVLTIRMRNNLAVTLNEAGKSVEAEGILRELVRLWEKREKRDMAMLLDHRYNLAVSLHRQGRHHSAVTEHQRVLELREQHHGRYHLKTIHSRQMLAFLLSDMGRRCEAALVMQMVVAHRAAAQGPGNFATIRNWRGLATMLSEMGLVNLAMIHQQSILERLEETYGPRHGESIAARVDYAWSLLRCAEYDEAFRHAGIALEAADKESLGAGKEQEKKRLEYAQKALDEVRRCRDAHEYALMVERVTFLDAAALTAYPKDHPARRSPRAAAVEKLWRGKQEKEALAECDAILAEAQTLKDLNGPANFHVRHLRADCQRRLDHLSESYQDLQELLEHVTQALGHDDLFTLAVRFSLAQTLRKLGQSQEAEPHLRQVVAHYARVLGSRHEATLMAAHFHGLALAELRRFEEGRWLWWQVWDGLVQTRRMGKPTVEAVWNRLISTRDTLFHEEKPSPVPFHIPWAEQELPKEIPKTAARTEENKRKDDDRKPRGDDPMSRLYKDPAFQRALQNPGQGSSDLLWRPEGWPTIPVAPQIPLQDALRKQRQGY